MRHPGSQPWGPCSSGALLAYWESDLPADPPVGSLGLLDGHCSCCATWRCRGTLGRAGGTMGGVGGTWAPLGGLLVLVWGVGWEALVVPFPLTAGLPLLLRKQPIWAAGDTPHLMPVEQGLPWHLVAPSPVLSLPPMRMLSHPLLSGSLFPLSWLPPLPRCPPPPCLLHSPSSLLVWLPRSVWLCCSSYCPLPLLGAPCAPPFMSHPPAPPHEDFTSPHDVDCPAGGGLVTALLPPPWRAPPGARGAALALVEFAGTSHIFPPAYLQGTGGRGGGRLRAVYGPWTTHGLLCRAASDSRALYSWCFCHMKWTSK